MTLTTYEPWNLVNRLHSQLGPLFDRPLQYDSETSAGHAGWAPAVDIREEDDSFVLSADLPGVDPKDIDVTMEDNELTIQGKRESHSHDEADGYHRVERASGQFYRRFTLPETANAEEITARGDHGVLEITIPKQARTQPRKIDVKH